MGKISRKRTRAQTLKLPAATPRNPLVAPALQRKAGAHRKSNKALRRGLRSGRKAEPE
ncbi:MAG: hypothetical protein J0I24_08695 [Thiomonas arsenitoxydans]|uniref:Uncharacterized protein n=1 Tax=Thiomonas arsenitoxydans (strain DSM 22701 / CIP 110005 / 3As) TaxID=426114 RepID=A0A8I1MY02_THIA3|nr:MULTISPECIES: hypothetical protein [Thiomonas]MBN8744373.1 hypothetical protein [Thiomonas arsenitoxydans]